MTTAATSPKQQRLYDIAERLRKFSSEIERTAEGCEESTDPNDITIRDFLYRAAGSIDDAAGILEDIKLP